MSPARLATTKELAVGGEPVWVTSPAPRDVWEELLAEDPFVLVTQSPGWLEARCRLGGYEDASRLYRLRDGRRVVLPLVRRRALRGVLALQLSLGEGWGMGGPVATGGVSRADLAVVAADLQSGPALRTAVRPNPLLAAEWSQAVEPRVRTVARLAHVLDLEGGFERVWDDRFTQLARRNVRKAKKAGVAVERGRSEAHLAAFHGLWRQSLERWATRQHEPLWLSRLRVDRLASVRRFRLLAATLGDAFGVWLASLDGRPVAGAIVLRGRNAHYTRGAMDADAAGPSRANYLLHAAAIRDACEAGCSHYHMGDTGTSQSLGFFKTRFGADAHPYAEYRFERLPFTPVDQWLRAAVKRVIGFTDAG